jgi:hypothetical protein
MTNELDASNIYALGVWLGNLEAIVKSGGTDWGNVRDTLQELSKFKDFEGLEFIGKDAQSDLYRFAKIYKRGFTRKLTEEDCETLNTLVHNWYGRLEEVKKRWIFSTPKTNLDILKLSIGAKSFFEETEWQALSELEQQGLNEAAKCLLTNNFTASEFMVLRTVESVLRRWYEMKTNKKLDSISQGQILNYLDKEYPEPQRPKEISALFHLKNRRNSIAHPDVISNCEEANVTFIYSVNMCKVAKQLKSSLL